jgi:hypothetical protein
MCLLTARSLRVKRYHDTQPLKNLTYEVLSSYYTNQPSSSDQRASFCTPYTLQHYLRMVHRSHMKQLDYYADVLVCQHPPPNTPIYL